MAPGASEPTDPAEVTRIVLRPIATPLPLGFLALCAATTGVSAVQLGWVAMSQAKTIGLVLMVLVAPLQFLAAVYGFLARDPVAGTGMGILSGTWAAVGFSWHTSGAAASSGLGVILVVVAANMLIPTVTSVGGKAVAGAVMFLAATRFAVTGAYELGGNSAVKTAAGWLGIALAVLAWYAALALEMEDARHRPLLPTARLGAAKESMTGSLGDQIAAVHHEAGVRQQL